MANAYRTYLVKQIIKSYKREDENSYGFYDCYFTLHHKPCELYVVGRKITIKMYNNDDDREDSKNGIVLRVHDIRTRKLKFLLHHIEYDDD